MLVDSSAWDEKPYRFKNQLCCCYCVALILPFIQLMKAGKKSFQGLKCQYTSKTPQYFKVFDIFSCAVHMKTCLKSFLRFRKTDHYYTISRLFSFSEITIDYLFPYVAECSDKTLKCFSCIQETSFSKVLHLSRKTASQYFSQQSIINCKKLVNDHLQYFCVTFKGNMLLLPNY